MVTGGGGGGREEGMVRGRVRWEGGRDGERESEVGRDG